MGRVLAIGDVHGCLTALDTLLGFVRPGPADQIVLLGDYVDRGPDSKGVLDRLVELRRARDVVYLRGNHEVMMLAAAAGQEGFRTWCACGGAEAMESYGDPDGVGTLDDIPDSHWHFLEHVCVDWYEADTHVFVHANLHPGLALREQPTEWLHWEHISATWQRPYLHQPHYSGKTMVCGHTEQRGGFPLVLERVVCIDTWAYGGGWLTCLDVGSGDYWQANELGQTREGRLPSRSEWFGA